MRRFEREVQGRKRFWEVDLRGTELTVRSGEVGRSDRTHTRELRTADLAARELADAVRQMVLAGWTEVAQEAIEPAPDEAHAAVLANPSDPSAYLVLGDQLQARGDARGELVALQAALAAGERRSGLVTAEQALLAEHRDLWLGPLIGMDSPWEVEWFCGYVQQLSLEASGYGTDTAAVLDALVDSGSLAFLRRLRIDGEPQFDAVAHSLRRRTWPVLNHLQLGSRVKTEPSWPEASVLTWPVGRLLETLPRLRTLEVALAPAGMGRLEHDQLESLVLRVRDGRVLRDLEISGLPALRSVTLDTAEPGSTEWPALVRALDRPLERLELSGPDVVGYITAQTPRSHPPERLVLGPSPNGPAIVDALRRSIDTFRGVHIELVKVDVSDADLEDLGALTLETDLPDVAVSPDRLYVSERQETPRRFEREANGTRFWEIVRDGVSIRVRYGRAGSKGTEAEQSYRTVERAASEYRKRVRKKRAGGWEEACG